MSSILVLKKEKKKVIHRRLTEETQMANKIWNSKLVIAIHGTANWLKNNLPLSPKIEGAHPLSPSKTSDVIIPVSCAAEQAVVYKNFHNFIVSNCKNLETVQVSVNRRMNKYILV